MKPIKILAGAALATMVATASFAGSFTLDSFDDAQVVDADNMGLPDTNTIPAGSFAAASRTFWADNTAPGANNQTTLEALGGQLLFSNNATAEGVATVTYNVVDLVFSVDGGAFFFDVGAFDDVADFNVTATDINGVVGTYDELLTPAFSPVLRFSELSFTDGPATAFDTNNVATLAFTISSDGLFTNTDGILNSIEVSMIPVPASGILLLGAAGGLVALRRRKDRATA